MKLNKSYLLGLSAVFLTIWVIGVVAWVTINTNPDSNLLHKGRLHTLYLSWGNDIWMKIWTGDSYLSILNWLIVWLSNEVIWSPKSVVIWWWYGNHIESQNAWIAGWQSNQINNRGDYSAIGWGRNNRILEENSIIAWWSGNESHWGVIIGWEGNLWYDGVVVLWGQGNEAYEKNSLVMWSWAIASEAGSFVWNDGSVEYLVGNAPENSARIDASNGVLIWTYQPTTGVKLVVNWAVKLWSENGNYTWEMSVDWNGCIWASDGVTGHVLGKGSESECTVVTGCLFGSTLLQNGDKVTAYVKPYSTDCTGLDIMCNGSKLCLSDDWTNCGYSYDKYYPYCYKISNSDDREYSIKPKILNRRDRITNPWGIWQEMIGNTELVADGQQVGPSQNQGQAGYLGSKN